MNERTGKLLPGLGITFTKPNEILGFRNSIKKEVEMVFAKWEPRLFIGMTPEDQKEMLNDLMKCI